MATDPLKLPVGERLRLVMELWDSIASDESNVPLTEAQRAELDLRLAAYEADKSAPRPAAEVMAEIRSKL